MKILLFLIRVWLKQRIRLFAFRYRVTMQQQICMMLQYAALDVKYYRGSKKVIRWWSIMVALVLYVSQTYVRCNVLYGIASVEYASLDGNSEHKFGCFFIFMCIYIFACNFIMVFCDDFFVFFPYYFLFLC